MIDGKRDRGRYKRKWDDDVKLWSGLSSFGKEKRKAEDILLGKT